MYLKGVGVIFDCRKWKKVNQFLYEEITKKGLFFGMKLQLEGLAEGQVYLV